MSDRRKKTIILIVPCFNEAARMPVDAFERADRDIVFVFVNDGSTDTTADVIAGIRRPHAHILALAENAGKAEAVRAGFVYCVKERLLKDAAWVGYYDADAATPLAEVTNMITYDRTFSLSADILFGSRVKRLGSDVARSGKRHLFGRMFASVISWLFKVPVYDSQCGAKLFRPHVVEKVFSEPFISRWIFDVEVLLRSRRFTIHEFPLFAWRDVKGSKISIVRDSFRVARDIWRIYRRYGSMNGGAK